MTLGLYPVLITLPQKANHKLPPSIWPELLDERQSKSLRQLAAQYDVSHEAVRQTLLAAQKHNQAFPLGFTVALASGHRKVA